MVIPHLPHHVTQRGSGQAQTFFSDDDYQLYLNLLRKHCTEAEVSILAWVPLPNLVHSVLTPREADAIRRALSKVHRTYAGRVHARMQRTGYFRPGPF